MHSSDFHPMRQVQRNPILGRMVDILGKVTRVWDEVDRDVGSKLLNVVVDAVAGPGGRHALDRDFAGSCMEEQVMLANATIRFRGQGRNIFAADPGIARMLARTDLGDARLDDLRLPYDNMFVALPRELSPGGLPGRGNVIDGAYVTLNRGVLDIILAGRVPAEGRAAWPRDEDPLLWLSVKPGKRLSEALADAVDEVSAFRVDANNHISRDAVPAPPITDAEKAVAVAAATLVLNIACYLTYAPEDVERVPAPDDAPATLTARAAAGDAQSAKAKRNLASAGFLPVVLVGRAMGARISQDRVAGTRPDGVATHWRRGHWRLQRHGKGLVETKLVWIWPVVVNGADGVLEGQGKVYLIRD